MEERSNNERIMKSKADIFSGRIVHIKLLETESQRSFSFEDATR